ncbi:MAG: DUF3102 domain-containing protein [Bauldia sp.]|nr:DUF3102 domain-containing protein [Bauldia sp.]
MNAMLPFDYSGVAEVEPIREAAVRIRLRMSRTAQDIIEIGRDLIEVKSRLGHGRFLGWIEAEFGMSDRAARNFMDVADRFGSVKSETISDLTPTVLYALAAPSTPDEVREEVVQRAAAGESITTEEVRRLKKQVEERDASLRTLKGQKDALASENQRLSEADRAKAGEIRRLNEALAEAEAGAPPEVKTVTVTDIGPWMEAFRALWLSAPEEARSQIKAEIVA